MPKAFLVFAVWLPSAVTGSACLELNGEPRQGALLWGQVNSASEVFLDDQALPLSVEGVFVFALSRNASGQRVLRVEGEDSCWKTLDIKQRDYRVQHIEGVPQKTVTPGPEYQQRIKREQALINRARSSNTPTPYFAQGFRWPATGPISGVYGSQRVYNGTPGRPHYGVDVASPTGTPVTAPASGKIVLAEADLFYSGGTVIIDHGMQVFSSFLHMSEVHAKVGDTVVAGELIGKIGATGRATGPHLDWRIKWRKHWVDPQLLVSPMP